MNIEDIKKGTHVFIPGVVDREPEGEYLYVTYKCGSNRNGLEYFRRADAAKLLIFHHENGTKNSEPAPKYDPYRKFRKGDKVRVVKWHGRACSKFWEPFVGMVMEVVESEDDCMPEVRTPKGWQPIDPPYLELVTPVEELEPYCIADHIHGWIVYKDNPGNVVANFNKTHPHAKQAAEAECARLNAEHRK